MLFELFVKTLIERVLSIWWNRHKYCSLLFIEC